MEKALDQHPIIYFILYNRSQRDYSGSENINWQIVDQEIVYLLGLYAAQENLQFDEAAINN